MNKCCLVVGLSTLCAFPVFAEEAVEEVDPNGGIVRHVSDRSKFIVVRDCQTAYPAEVVKGMIVELEPVMRRPIAYVSGTNAFAKAGATVILVDESRYGGATLLAAPEQGWSEVAVKRLVADNPDAEKKFHRLNLELMRAMCFAVGVGSNEYLPNIMTTMKDVDALDRSKMDRPNPPTEIAMDQACPRWGVQKIRYASYRIACKQGWAPEPTNDVQKAIWKAYHTEPTQPMEIKAKKQ